MPSQEVGTAYVKVVPKTDKGALGNVQRDIEGVDGGSAGSKVGSAFGRGLSAVGVGIGNILSGIVSKAAGAIADSVGDAVARVDTLSNFPKIMANMGYGADEATAAIKRISSSLDGLPTSTDAIAQTVQKLAPLTTSLDEATDISLALNNALLAGGKSTQSQANALEQYSQMLAAGKVDMQSWRSMLDAMPMQLNQLSEALLGAGHNQSDLYEALKSGEVTFDEFNDALVRLNAEGINGLGSFEDQARAATGGIGTAMENMKNRTVRSIATVIDAIGQENIAGAINAVSSQFQGVGDGIAAFITSFKEGFDTSEVEKRLKPWLEGLPDIAGGFKEAASALGERFGRTMTNVMPGAVDVFTSFTDVAADAADITGTLGGMFGDALYGGMSDVYTALTGEQMPSWDEFCTMMETQVIPDLQQRVVSALDDVHDRLDIVKDVLDGDWESAWEKASTIPNGDVLMSNLTAISDFVETMRRGEEIKAQWISDKLSPFLDKLSDFRSGNGWEFHRIMGAIKDTARDMEGPVTHLNEAFDGLVESLGRLVATVIPTDEIRQMLSVIAGGADAGGEGAGEGLSTMFTGAIEIISEVVEKLPDVVDGIADVIDMATDLSDTVTYVVDTVKGKVDEADQGWQEFKEDVEEDIQGAVDTVTAIPGQIAEALATVFDVLTTPFRTACEWIETNVPQDVRDAVIQLPGTVASLIAGVGETLSAPFRTAADDIATVPDRIIAAFRGLGERISQAFGSVRFPKPHIDWQSVQIGSASISIPSIEWYARGGYAADVQLLGMGEEDAEGIVPLQGRHMYPLADAIAERMGSGRTVNVYVDGDLTRISRIAEETFDGFMDELSRYGAMQGAI